MKKLTLAVILCLFALPVCADESDLQAKYETLLKEHVAVLSQINQLSNTVINLTSQLTAYQARDRMQRAAGYQAELKAFDDQRQAEAEQEPPEPKKKRRVESR